MKAIPGQGSRVPITLLGSSGFSAQLAGKLGLPFAFAAHIAPEHLHAATALYFEQFRPSDSLAKPHLMVSVLVIAGETDADARRLFISSQQRFLRLIRNQSVELVPPVNSMEPLWEDAERAAVASRMSAAVVGSVRTVKAGLDKLIADTGAHELIVISDTYEHADRLSSYEGVAEVAKEMRFAPARIVETAKP